MKKYILILLIVLLTFSVSMTAFAGKSNACGGLENAYWRLAPDNPDRADLIANMQAADCDDDGDGIINVLDACAGTETGAPVNEDGCAIEQQMFTLYLRNDAACTITGTIADVSFVLASGQQVDVTVHGGLVPVYAATDPASVCGFKEWQIDLYINETLEGIIFIEL